MSDVLVLTAEARELKSSARLAYDLEADLASYFGRGNVRSHVEERRFTFTCRVAIPEKPIQLLYKVFHFFDSRSALLRFATARYVGLKPIRHDYAGTRAQQRQEKADRSAVKRYKLKGDGYIPASEEDE